MSDEQLMRGILQTRLLTLGWETQTAFEGKQFTPNASQPYQEVTTTFMEPLPIGLAGTDELRGQFQVRLLYPLSMINAQGIGVPMARAKQIKALFPRTATFESGGQVVKIMRSPLIARGPVQGDRDVTIIRVRFGDR